MASPKKLLVSMFAGLLLTILVASAAAQVELRSGRDVTLSGDFEDMGMIAGGRVAVTAKTPDDILAAGGDITLIGARGDHLIIAGGNATFSEFEAQDVFVAGGDVDLQSGIIQDDLVAAGGLVALRSGLSVGGSGLITGGDVIVEASFDNEIRLSGGSVRLDAVVGGDVELTANKAAIGPKTRIAGNLRYSAGTITIDAAAVIEGQTIQLPPAEDGEAGAKVAQAIAALAMLAIVFLLGFLVLVLVLVAVWPGLMRDSAAMIQTKPLATLGVGFLIVAAAPAVLFLLFVSAVGIPLALLVIALYVAMAPIALAAFAYTAGLWARRRVRKQDSPPGLATRLGWAAVAVLVLVVVGLIPFLGGLAWLTVLVFGVGAVATQGWRALSKGAGEATVSSA